MVCIKIIYKKKIQVYNNKIKPDIEAFLNKHWSLYNTLVQTCILYSKMFTYSKNYNMIRKHEWKSFKKMSIVGTIAVIYSSEKRYKIVFYILFESLTIHILLMASVPIFLLLMFSNLFFSVCVCLILQKFTKCT